MGSPGSHRPRTYRRGQVGRTTEPRGCAACRPRRGGTAVRDETVSAGCLRHYPVVPNSDRRVITDRAARVIFGSRYATRSDATWSGTTWWPSTRSSGCLPPGLPSRSALAADPARAARHRCADRAGVLLGRGDRSEPPARVGSAPVVRDSQRSRRLGGIGWPLTRPVSAHARGLRSMRRVVLPTRPRPQVSGRGERVISRGDPAGGGGCVGYESGTARPHDGFLIR